MPLFVFHAPWHAIIKCGMTILILYFPYLAARFFPRKDCSIRPLVSTVFGKHCECNAHKFTHLKRLPPLGSHLLLLSPCVLTHDEDHKKSMFAQPGIELPIQFPLHDTKTAVLIVHSNTRELRLFLSNADTSNYKSQIVLKTEKFR